MVFKVSIIDIYFIIIPKRVTPVSKLLYVKSSLYCTLLIYLLCAIVQLVEQIYSVNLFTVKLVSNRNLQLLLNLAVFCFCSL